MNGHVCVAGDNTTLNNPTPSQRYVVLSLSKENLPQTRKIVADRHTRCIEKLCALLILKIQPLLNLLGSLPASSATLLYLA